MSISTKSNREIEDASKRQMQAKHIHQFTVPVEWIEQEHGFDNRAYIIRQLPVKTKVTKLRCICGEEIDR